MPAHGPAPGEGPCACMRTGWAESPLAGLARAFGSTRSSSGPGDIAWVFIVVGLAVAGCVVASFLVPPAWSRRVAMAPILLVILGQGLILRQEKARAARYAREELARRKLGEAKLRRTPPDEPIGRLAV